MKPSALLLLVAIPVLSACNPTGTCIQGEETSASGAMCVIGTNEKACTTMAEPRTFYPEDQAAGVLRCKGQGFEGNPAPDGISTLFKKAKK